MQRSVFARPEYSVVLGVVVFLGVGLWGLDVWLLDGITGTLFAFSGVDTVYSSGYSAAGFRSVRAGMADEEVVSLIGPPLREVHLYRVSSGDVERVVLEEGRAVEVIPGDGEISRMYPIGLSRRELAALVGEPISRNWIYSKSRSDGSYRIRLVKFEDERVVEKVHVFYFD